MERLEPADTLRIDSQPESSLDQGLGEQKLEEQLSQNEHDINRMETFIQNKYLEVADLQKYLVEELQSIEDCKERNRRIERILVVTALPALAQVKDILASLKPLLVPFCQLAVSYVKAIGQKSACLLQAKQLINQQNQAQIQRLRLQLTDLRQERQKEIEIEIEKQKQKIRGPVTEANAEAQEQKNKKGKCEKAPLTPISSSKSESQVLRRKDSAKNGVYSKGPIQFCHQNSQSSLKSMRGDKPRPSSKAPRQLNQSSLKANKYEEEYQNILESRKANIQYRCQKSPVFGSGSPSNPSRSLRKADKEQIERRQGTRKECIRQKISLIKTKAELRQCNNYEPRSRPR